MKFFFSVRKIKQISYASNLITVRYVGDYVKKQIETFLAFIICVSN